MNVNRSYWWLVNIGLAPSGNKSMHEPVMTRGCFTTLGKLLKWVFVAFHFRWYNNIPHSVKYSVLEITWRAASSLQRHHLISNTNYAANLTLWTHHLNLPHENSFGELTKFCETPLKPMSLYGITRPQWVNSLYVALTICTVSLNDLQFKCYNGFSPCSSTLKQIHIHMLHVQNSSREIYHLL